MKHAVTGAFSYSGKYITRRLLEQGHEVITLTGHPGRQDPFSGKVQAFPLDFEVDSLTTSLRGVDTLYNTYWIRFDYQNNTQLKAVQNTATLVQAAARAGVRRIVHVSITNPSLESSLPYFFGKAKNEQAVKQSGMSYAILRPTVLFGVEDILINNIAYLLRRFPLFAVPGNGSYQLQPIFVDDLADIAVRAGELTESVTWDAVGPDIFSFEEMVRLVGSCIGCARPLVYVPPGLALAASKIISGFVGDIILTQDEVDGLMAGLLVSSETPMGSTHLEKWLQLNRTSVGNSYASELTRHYV